MARSMIRSDQTLGYNVKKFFDDIVSQIHSKLNIFLWFAYRLYPGTDPKPTDKLPRIYSPVEPIGHGNSSRAIYQHHTY